MTIDTTREWVILCIAMLRQGLALTEDARRQCADVMATLLHERDAAQGYGWREMKKMEIVVRWVLVAEPYAMRRAEEEVLGADAETISSGVYSSDAVGAAEVARKIELEPHAYEADMLRMSDFWRIAAYLGRRGVVSVYVETDVADLHVNVGKPEEQYISIRRSTMDARLLERMANAVNLMSKAQEELMDPGAAAGELTALDGDPLPARATTNVTHHRAAQPDRPPRPA